MIKAGLNLKAEHYQEILELKPKIDFFEIISENFFAEGGKSYHYLEKIREHYPLSMHSVSMSLGSSDPLNFDYLKKIKTLIDRVHPLWVSDHLCWTGINGINTHDLLPLPYTEETLAHTAARITQVQEFLSQKILIENVSSYLTYQDSEMQEWEFLNAVAKCADCYILLDINNIYVSSRNHHFNPLDYINGIDITRVREHHLAGHSDYGTHVIDTHDQEIVAPVWDLYQKAHQRFGIIPTVIERDGNIPPLSELMDEVCLLKKLFP